MKKPFNYGLFAIVALAIPFTFAHAEASAVASEQAVAQAKPTVTTTTTVSTETQTPESLAARKATAEANLRALQTQFALFATRTQATIDRLKAKKIDTAKAQAALDASTASLATAKANLDLFAGIVVTEDTKKQVAPTGQNQKRAVITVQQIQQDTTEIKTSLKKIEENLTDARTHLIESLTALKTTVSISIDAQ